MAKSILDSPVATAAASSKRFRSYSMRISAMWWRGMPMATCSCAAGRLTRVIISVTG